MRVLVIGANGLTGQRIVKRLTEGSHDPVAMIRDSSQRETFDALGVPTVLGDLEYPIDHAVRGCDAIIFAAGSGSSTGPDKTVLVDQLGAIRSMVAAQTEGARRYLMLSSIGADIQSESRIAHYHRAKGYADEHLMSSDLDWTVVCPGGLREEPGTGTVAVSADHLTSGLTSRDNLAAALVACLDLPNTVGKRFSLLEGDTPIEEALRSL